MLRASDRPSFVLAIAIALALGGPGLGAFARAQVPAPSGGDTPQGSSGSTPDSRQPNGGVEVFPYRVPGRALLIPTNGALPIESFSRADLPIVAVADTTGAVVPGLLHEVGISDHGVMLAWVPTAPLSIGFLSVELSSPFDSNLAQVVPVRVEAPFPRELPPIDMEVSASLVTLPEWRECCRGVPGGPPNGCFTHTESYVRVEPGFTSRIPSAFLSQYLFRIKPAPGSGAARVPEFFKPFEQPDEIRFYEPAREYCLQVEALNIATRELHIYPVIGCTPFDEMDEMIGKQSLGDLAKRLAYEACPLPPDSQIERWCDVNTDLCSTEDPQACAIHEHLCNGAPAPAIVHTLQSSQPVSGARIAHDGGPSVEPDACSASPAPRKRAPLVSLLGLLTVAGLALFRKRR